MERIIVKDIIKTDLAVTADKAKYVYEILKRKIEAKQPVTIDFSGIKTLTTAFLNISIGQLYTVTDRETLNQYLKIDVKTLQDWQISKLKMVMSNSQNKLALSQGEIDQVVLHGSNH